VKPVHPSIRKALELPRTVGTAEVLREWKRRTSTLCKPCWELHYCPYGPVVEDFPLLPPVRSEAERHNEHLRSALRTGRLTNGKPLDARRRRVFRDMVAAYKAGDFPETIPKVLTEASCRVFGHLCPVFFVAEPLTETKDLRSHTRVISREVMLKSVDLPVEQPTTFEFVINSRDRQGPRSHDPAVASATRRSGHRMIAWQPVVLLPCRHSARPTS
jgi:hypothetical protein